MSLIFCSHFFRSEGAFCRIQASAEEGEGASPSTCSSTGSCSLPLPVSSASHPDGGAGGCPRAGEEHPPACPGAPW